MSSQSQASGEAKSNGDSPGEIIKDKAARVKAVCALFVPAEGKFKCLVASCKATVACQDARGAPGREQHLQHHHPQEYNSLPQKATRKSSEPQSLKRSRNDDTILWICRRAHPFTELDDEYVSQGCTITRKNFLEHASVIAGKFIDEMLACSKGKRVSFAVDGGTNAETKTQNLCANINGVSWFLEASRLDSSAAVNIQSCLEFWVERFRTAGAVVVGGIADNAANEQLALQLLKFPVRASCACHTVQLFVKQFAITERDLELIEKCRAAQEADCPTLPQIVDSRWNSVFLALDVVVKNWSIFVAYGAISRDESEELKDAHVTLLTHYNDSLRCEGDGKHLYCALMAFLSFRRYDAFPGFNEKWERNVSKPWVIVAALLLPQLIPESLETCLQARAKKILTAFVRTIKLDADDGELGGDVEALFDGSLQRVWRQRRGSTVEEYWGALPPLFSDIATTIAAVPASSANVERSFSMHARQHTSNRKSLGEASVNVVMQIAMGQVAVPQKGGFAPIHKDSFAHATLEWVIEMEVRMQTIRETRELKAHDRVIVFLLLNVSAITRPKKKSFPCKLLRKVGLEWDVMWDSEKGKQTTEQRFAPLEDEWTFENK